MSSKIMAVGMLGFLCLSITDCGLIGAGAGRRLECSRIAGLVRTGEHKPAADSYDELVRSGSSCSESVDQRVAISRSKVERADNFVRKAFKRRKEGNLLSARANLEEALKIYPNYYWVQNLLKNLERSIEAEINGLKGEAQYLESSGDLSGALKRIGEALSLSPGDPSLQAELNRLQAASEKAQMELELTTVVGKVQEYMNAGRFDEAEGILRSKDVARQLGPRGDEMLKQVAKSRSRLINQRYSVARETEQKGEIEVAAGHASYVLELSRPNDPFTPEVVEFARLLGVKLFSAGKLVRAKEVWSAAYDLDPENEKLDNYLNEVNARLESLEKIKGDEGAGK